MNLPKELTIVTPLSRILAIIVILTLPVVGFLMGFRYQSNLNQASQQPSTDNLLLKRVPPPSQTMDTLNWKTYTNTIYDYSFRYPSEWNISKRDSAHIYLAKGYTFPTDKKNWGPYDLIAQEKDTQKMASIQFSNIDDVGISKGSLEQVAKNWRAGKQKIATIDSNKAIEVRQPPVTAGGGSILGNPSTIAVFVRDAKNRTYLLQLETENITFFEPVFEQILQTFKFN